MIRGKFADQALDILRYQPSRGARLLEAVLKSAIGNAQDSEQQEDKQRTRQIEELVVMEAHVDGGPVMKRIRPMSRGQAFGILKRSAHITVSLVAFDEL